jgi:UDP-N-acetylglucosamine 2-epimerase
MSSLIILNPTLSLQTDQVKRLKVLSVVGTRPELIRLSRVFPLLDVHCEHTLVHTGQNYDYELNQIFFNDLQLRKPDYFLDCTLGSTSVGNTIGNLISKVDDVFSLVKPDAVLVLGDTNSCLSVIPAKRRKIPIFHMEAGNRCFDQRVPEETNRRIVDHTSDINMTYSTIAREYLLREGFPPDQIIKTGSPMFEVLNHYLPHINASDICSRLGLEYNQYFLVSLHREENIDLPATFDKVHNTLNQLAEEYSLPIVVSTHPRTMNRITSSETFFHPLVSLMKPLGFFDYVNLQINAKCVLSDSGTISEESSILNFPALNLRESHERPEAFEEGSVMMVGLDYYFIKQGLEILASQLRGNSRNLRLVADYSCPNVSEKVLRIILSYTHYIQRIVWKSY